MRPRALSRASRYATEAVLPFYVLHQTPIVAIAFYVVQWNTIILLKYLTISLASLLVMLIVYDVCVRRLWLTRMLFGMPPSKLQPFPVPREPVGDRR